MLCDKYLISWHGDYSSGNERAACLIHHAVCMCGAESNQDRWSRLADTVTLKLWAAFNWSNTVVKKDLDVCRFVWVEVSTGLAQQEAFYR